nr:response regulator [Desulfosporosinus sp. SRJS8]
MNKHILIADDNDDILEILHRHVTEEGFLPIVTHNDEEALKKFYEFAPVLLLLDVMIPEKDGFEVCKEIRSNSNVPIILITAKGDDGDRIMGLDIGADDYIVKP